MPPASNAEKVEPSKINVKNKGKQTSIGADSKSTGYSTDVDQLTRAKKLIALENRWKQMIK
jgi:hypothetical protein